MWYCCHENSHAGKRWHSASLPRSSPTWRREALSRKYLYHPLPVMPRRKGCETGEGAWSQNMSDIASSHFLTGQQKPVCTHLQTQAPSQLLQMQRPFVLLKLAFVVEVAGVVVLGGRKMPTTWVFNTVNVSVYACTGCPNYPVSSKISCCNYRSLPWHLLLKGESSAAGAQCPSALSKLPATPAAGASSETVGASWAHFRWSLQSKCHSDWKVGNVCQAGNKAVNESYSNLLSHNPFLSLIQPTEATDGSWGLGETISLLVSSVWHHYRYNSLCVVSILTTAHRELAEELRQLRRTAF